MTALPATKSILLERQGSLLRIWLNRVAARNALSAEMTRELAAVLEAVGDDRSVRSIVLRGKGGVFCAGADLNEFKAAQASEAGEVARDNRAIGDLMARLNEQPQVVVILVEGAAIGGGLGLACVGDITLVTRDTRFRLSETSLGLPPAQIAPFVRERVGLTQARRLMLTGAQFDGADALALGLAHGVAADAVELEEQCAAVLEQVARCAPGANAVTKSILLEAPRRPRAELLDDAAAKFASCLLGDEGREGVAAFFGKRRPRWAPACKRTGD